MLHVVCWTTSTTKLQQRNPSRSASFLKSEGIQSCRHGILVVGMVYEL